MRVFSIAKKDYRDASQSRALWGLTVVFTAVMLLLAYVFVEAPELFGGLNDPAFPGLLSFAGAGVTLFVPLAAIIVCYKSVAGEREIGSIKVIMSLPTTRSDVFFGKVLGRGAVLTTAVGIGVLAGVLLGSILLGSIDVPATLVFLFVTVFFAVAYAGIMVGLSALSRSTVRATAAAIGFFVVFELLWDIVPLGVLYVVSGFQLPGTFPDWFTTFVNLSPATAYSSLIYAVVPGIATGAPSGGDLGIGFYADALVAVLVLLAWLVVSLAIGYIRFDRADL